MKRLTLTLAVAALAAAFLPVSAQAAYGLKDLDVTFSGSDGGAAMQAGAHPYAFTTSLAFNTKDDGVHSYEVPDGSTKDLIVKTPPGFAANPTATPLCTTLEFLAGRCPMGSQIGVNRITLEKPDIFETVPVYNLTPPPGAAAKFGFIARNAVPITIEGTIDTEPPYAAIGTLKNTPQALPVYAASLTLWGVPADPAHNPQREDCVGECAAGLAKVPFLTSPRACTGPLPSFFKSDSWENPGVFDEPPPVLTHDSSIPPQPLGFSGCAALGFAPHVSAQPTSKAAEAPTGLDFDIEIDDQGIANPDGIADSDIKKAVVTLPEGMTANPSLAETLATCSSADFARETLSSEPGQGCPQASKLGSLEAETPLLEDKVIKGEVFIAAQNDNPFNSLLALYMVIRDRELGVLIKLAGKVEPDPQTGQLTTTFDDLPQLPVSRFHFHFREGARSPLVTPPRCGAYQVRAEFTPWADPSRPLSLSAPFEVTQGVNGAPCPTGPQPFDPGFQAGTLQNDAGSHSPFHMRLTRKDGDQDLTRFSAKLPPGMVAKLAGTALCPDASIEAAKGKSGRAELADPSCPASSQIGRALGGAGVGSQLTYVPGKIYLAGPHNGAPLSVAAIVPAVAGPFDVGNVVVRQALRVNPRSGVVIADGASSDPLPHILAGIPLRVRDIRVYVDRPNFTLNPTSCEPAEVAAEIFGGGSNVFSSLDDSPLSREARFQAANCAALGFKPRLALRLKGGIKRGAHPALKGTYRPRPGDANLEDLVLRLPRSAFLDQAHIRTICTRVQFAANGGNGAGCPPGAIYGHATAYTPILEQPLSGPVFLRSSDNNLPDFVAALEGLVDVEAVARIDSVRGGIRASFEDVPDAPLSKVVVEMQGAKKGLIVNSKNLCAAKNRANAQMAGHNGRRANGRPVVKASCGKGRGAKRAGPRRP